MKITLQQPELLRIAAIASGAAGFGNSLPILDNVLIDATETGVEARAGNYDLRVKMPVDATVFATGIVTVPAKTLADLASKLPDDTVILEQQDKAVLVQCRDTKAELAAMPAEDYPAWPDEPEDASFSISAENFQRIIDNVLPFVPTKDPRRVLQGVLLEVTPGMCAAVATDGKILSRIVLDEPTGVSEPLNLNLPSFLLMQAAKLANGEPVTIIADERQVLLQVDGVRYLSNLVDGRYPDYNNVVPRDFGGEVAFMRQPMLRALRRAMILTDRVNLAVEMEFTGDKCTLIAEDYERGRYTENVLAVGDVFSVAMNVKFLQATLAAFDGNPVRMRFNAPTQPVIFDTNDGTPDYLLVMPIKKTEAREPEPEEEEVPA